MISDFCTIFKYYVWFGFNPINFSTIWDNKHSPVGIPKCSLRSWLLYMFTRLLPFINVLCVLRLIYYTIADAQCTGKLSLIDLVGLLLWLLAFPPLFYSDMIFTCQGNLTRNFMRTMDLIEGYWKTLKDNAAVCRDDLEKIEKRKTFKCWRLMSHTMSIDFITLVNFGWNLYSDFESDPTTIYSTLPWRNPFFNFIFWILNVTNLTVLSAGWSFMLSFPGVIGFHYECILKALSVAIKCNLRNGKMIHEILQIYKNIQFSIREVARSGSAKWMFLFYGTCGVQQTIESYFVFSYIRMGASWADYQWILMDILYTSSRVIHGFYAISTVDSACQNFFDSIRSLEFKQRKQLARRMKTTRGRMSTLKPVRIHIGPCKCKKDMPLVGASIYLDNVVNAALWK